MKPDFNVNSRVVLNERFIRFCYFPKVMSIYQTVWDFGKRILLTGGLITILCSCGGADVEKFETTQIFKDLNRDGKPEHIYMLWNGKFGAGGAYEIFVKEGKGNAKFGEPKAIVSLPIEPEEIKIDDVNGDGIQDLLYLIWNRKLGSDSAYVLALMEGRGDGSFKYPEVIESFKIKPEGLY